MQRFFRHIVLTITFLACFTIAQAQGIIENIGGSMGSGNVGGISRYFDNAVSMTISGNQSTYSRSQAEMVLRDFFSKNSAKGFSIERRSSGGNCYAIGTLNTSNGTYRAYISMKQKDGNYVIQEIRLEK